MEMLNIESVSYLDIFKLVPSFISLDISKNATGWVKWLNEEVTTGVFSITAPEEDEVGRRRQFREFLKELFGDDEFEYLFIEDVIGSVNFKTAKILYQLNTIPDDMVVDGVIKAKTIIREDNKVWKKNLKSCSGYVSKVRSDSDDKKIVRESLYLLGFGDGTNNVIKQDIYDAIGLAVGVIFKKFILKEDKSKRKLRKDISRGYKIHQFSDYYQALDDANEVGGEIYESDFTNAKKDLKYNFKKLIEELEDDGKTFLIKIPTCKIGAVALDKGLDLNMETSYLVVYRKR